MKQLRKEQFLGGVLCGVETDKVNTTRQTFYTMLGPNMPVQNLIFVDDILLFGSARIMSVVVENLKGLEIDRNILF